VDVDVVLPCRDEAAALPALLAAFPPGLVPLVVDNDSRDGTAGVARSLGARVVHEPAPGYGAAVHTGVLAARPGPVAVIDADGSLDPACLVGLVHLVADGRADLAVGRRRPVERGAWPWHARAGTALVAARLRRETGVPVHDIAPVRVCDRDALLRLGVEDRRFGYPLELLVRAGRAGWTVVERDVPYGCRAAGTRSKVSGSIRGSWRAARDFRAVLS
jgi:glycosyltransferase involved in cell wall biosynthesis